MRGALRALVARNGFHGASMSAVAREGGVATGTAYTHYASKDELVLAAYRETKAQLAAAAAGGLGAGAEPAAEFRGIWLATCRQLKANPDHADFLLQVDHSPTAPPRTRCHSGKPPRASRGRCGALRPAERGDL